MKACTVLAVLYGINLALALVGAGFLAAFLGQLYAEDPLMVFEMPVAVWVNGVIAFFALLIVYLVIWFVFRVIHYDSGFTTALADALAMIVFTLGGVATTAGLTGENVFRLNCRAQPMWPDVLALCLPAAIGAAIAWAQIGLLLFTLTFIVVTMRDYPEGWKHSLYRLCHPKRVKPIITLDKSGSGSGSAGSRSSSFGTPSSTERAPLVCLIPEYPPPGAPHRTPAHRPSGSISSNSNGSIVSPTSPVSVSSWSPTAPYGSPPHWPTRLPPAGIYSAYADSVPVPTESYWTNDTVITPPELARYGPNSLELERLVTPPSPTPLRVARSNETQQLYSEKQPLSPLRLTNPSISPSPTGGIRRVRVPPFLEHPLSNRRGGLYRTTHQRSVSTPSPAASILEKEYAAAAMNGARLSQDFDPASSQAPSWLQPSPRATYPPEKQTYQPEKVIYDEPATLSAPSTPKMRRQFQVYDKGHPPLPSQWGNDEYERDQVERARRKLSLEHDLAESSRRARDEEEAFSDYESDFGYASDQVMPKASTSKLPRKISPGEALGLPLPRNEWEPKVKRARPGDEFRI